MLAAVAACTSPPPTAVTVAAETGPTTDHTQTGSITGTSSTAVGVNPRDVQRCRQALAAALPTIESAPKTDRVAPALRALASCDVLAASIQAAARAIYELPIRFDEEFRVNLVCDAAENALWSGRGPWLKRWLKELNELRTNDRSLVDRLDAVSWLLGHADEVGELLLHDDLQPVLEFLRTAWQLPDELLRAPWQRHLVGLREFDLELEQVAADMHGLAPNLAETYLELLKRVPLHLDAEDEVYIRGWLQRQETVIDQHPMRIFGHLRRWPIYLSVLVAGAIIPPFIFLAVPVYILTEKKLRYRLYNEYVRRSIAHLCRTRGYARLEVLHVLEKTRLENLQDMKYTLEQDVDIDVEGATVKRTR